MTTEKTKKWLKYGSILALFLIIFGYGAGRSRDLLFGIRLTVVGLTDGMITEEGVLTFSGTARHATGMTINGKNVPVSREGVWTNTVALMPGYNVISISVADKFRRTIKKTYRINYKQADTPPIFIPETVAPTPPTTTETVPITNN